MGRTQHCGRIALREEGNTNGVGEYLYEMRCGKKEARLIEEGKTKGPDEGWYEAGKAETVSYEQVMKKNSAR